MEHFGSQPADKTIEAPRDKKTAILRGFRCRCPNCGEGKLFRSYLKTVDECAYCGEEIKHHRADDFPAYLTIFIVGHIIVAAYMSVDQVVELEMWQQMALWIPLTGILSLLLLQPLKGGVIGLQWALRMHGFGGIDEDAIAAGSLSDEQAR
ncbi:MAG: hypothetical protein CME90_01890 [Hoeflea sp.]|nr:hypothetical protein [Hoeflea sp.]